MKSVIYLNPIKNNKQWCSVLSMIKLYVVVQFHPWFNTVYGMLSLCSLCFLIFLQLLHQTLRAHQVLFCWPCFLLQPFFCVSLLEPGLHGLLQTSQKSRNGAQTLYSGLRQFLPAVSLSPYFPLAGYTDQQLALLLLKDDLSFSTVE